MADNPLMIERMTISYAQKVIGEHETPKWKGGGESEFLKSPSPDSHVEFESKELLMPDVKLEVYINQLGSENFRKFNQGQVIKQTGYNSELMRAHGCGISVLQMVNATLAGKNYLQRYPSVDSLAIALLAEHKDDLRDSRGNRIKRGTPVFTLQTGWYHDAMLYGAREFAGLEVLREENITSLNQVAIECVELANQGQKAMVIISVRNDHWRIKGEPTSVATHLVIVNGFKFNESGDVSEIRVTDPFAPNGEAKLNQWIAVDERVKQAFTGRALFFATSR